MTDDSKGLLLSALSKDLRLKIATSMHGGQIANITLFS
jgi:hypothetical protein